MIPESIFDLVSQSNETAQNLVNEMAVNKHTQHAMILSILQRGESLTGLEALERVGTMKLASRVSELRRAGYDIKSETIITQTGKRVSQYWI